MNTEEALAIIETALGEECLSKLQKMVFCQTWEEQSYQEIAQASGYEVGYVKQAGSQLWQAISRILGEKVSKNNVHSVVKRLSRHPGGVAYYPSNTAPLAINPRQDWGDAPDASIFYGRTAELKTLERWIVQDRCRLIGLFGMGGIGKTSLAVKLAKQLQGEFDYLIWRSLRNAPPIQNLLVELIQFFSNQQEAQPATLESSLLRLLDYLRMYRCLLVLDNGEAIMRYGNCGGSDQKGYEGYAQLLQCVGETHHQSVVVLTSREKPVEIAVNEGESLPIRSLRQSSV